MFKRITLFAGLLLVTLCGCNSVAEPKITYQRSADTASLKIGKRHRVVKTPMIYGRIQPYDLYNNYLHQWIDRPLFHNRQWRNSPNGRLLGFSKDMALASEYAIDGFTMLGDSYQSRYRKYLKMVEDGKPEKFKFMPGMAWRRRYDKQAKENFRLGVNSKYSPRINGKIPFFPYGSAPLEKIGQTQAALVRDGYENILLFVPVWLDVFSSYRHKTIAPEILAIAEKKVQRKLAVVDGLVLINYHMYRNPLGNYTLSRKFYYEMDDKYIAPLFEKVYAKPENADKLLCFDIRHGYIGFMSGTNEAEYGTSQLRQAMNSALLFNPDIISLIEWNEANENTSFQPTVYNSKSVQRIIKFYACKIKELPLTPNKGDDLSIPNMIVSTRQVIAIGEKYRIELLNVPDSNSTKTYSVQLTLRDQAGNIIKTFAPDSFCLKNLTAVTYTVPSEQIPNVLAVIPELQIIGSNGDRRVIKNLQYTRLNPTVCWNFKEVRQPLRDLLFPEECQFKVKVDKQPGNYTLTGSIETPDTLASVEILNQEYEVFAVDKANEFKLQENNLLRISFSSKQTKLRRTTIRIPGINDFIFRPWSYPYAGFGKLKKNDDTIQGKLLLFRHGASLLLAIPKAKTDIAEIKFDITGLGEFKFSVKEIMEKGKIVLELPEFTLVKTERMDRLADHPLHLGEERAKFSTVVKSEFKNSCFQLRAITESGKIYRSKPIFPKTIKGKAETINLFSTTLGKAVSRSVQSSRIVDINYRFTPANGALLRDPENSRFDAYLGGGFAYGWPMRSGALPAKAAKTAPQWIKDKTLNAWTLSFDGIGNYLVFPMETLPHGAFTLEFECKSESKANQVLFRHNNHRPGSLLMYIIDGKLQVDFISMGNNYSGKPNKLVVDLPFPEKQWVKVKVVYDLHKINVTVNQKTVTIPFKLRASKPTSAIFGGFSSGDRDIKGKDLKFFHGELRSLRIRHNAEK
jgi:laminin G domain protein